MSDAPLPNPDADLPPADRYAFNLPPGSVRGLLVLMIMVPFWIMLGWPEPRLGPMPFYIYFLMTWVFLFLFSPVWSISTQEASSDQPAEWNLPRYTIHFLLAAVTIGLIVLRLVDDPSGQRLAERLQPDESEMKRLPFLLLSMFAGFIPGWLTSHLLGKAREIYWFQDLQAWVSLLAMFGLAALTILHVMNAFRLDPFTTNILEYIVIGIVGWYFGARAPAAYAPRRPAYRYPDANV